MATYTLRGNVMQIDTASIAKAYSGFYFPVSADDYDSNHAFLYFYTQYKYGGVLDPFAVTPTPSGSVPGMNGAGSIYRAP